jgi:hypothetical protein
VSAKSMGNAHYHASEAKKAPNHSAFHPLFICRWVFGLAKPATLGKIVANQSSKRKFRLKGEEIPRLCRGGSSSLTFTGVHPRDSLREPTKAHVKENSDGPVGEAKPLRMGV